MPQSAATGAAMDARPAITPSSASHRCRMPTPLPPIRRPAVRRRSSRCHHDHRDPRHRAPRNRAAASVSYGSWMTEKRTTARALHDADGVEDWRVLFSGAHAFFRVKSFEHGARFVAAIAEVAEAVGHFPDVDLRPEGVTVRTASGEYGAVSQRGVQVARRLSVEARRVQVEPDPLQVQVVGINVAQDAGSDVGPFWAAVLGYRGIGADEDVVDPHRRNPHVAFQRLRRPRPGRGRLHIDVSVPADQAEARVAAALAAGGRLGDATHAPLWWTLASPENHGVDIAAWPDFDENDS